MNIQLDPRVKDVGVIEVMQFLQNFHPKYELPAEAIFAFKVAFTPIAEVYVLVCEANDKLKRDGFEIWDELGLSDQALALAQESTAIQARLCGVSPPYSYVMMTRLGVLSAAAWRERLGASAA